MRAVAAHWLMAGTLAIILAVGLSAQAPRGGNQIAPQASSHSAQGGEKNLHSPAYQLGYRDGKRDRSDNLQPRPWDENWNSKADRRAYDHGYRAGYCADEPAKTGNYNGTYGSTGLPVLQNGYYGYNAPDPECVIKSQHGQ